MSVMPECGEFIRRSLTVGIGLEYIICALINGIVIECYAFGAMLFIVCP